MKKLVIILLCLSILVLPFTVSAAASASVKLSSSSVKIGNTFTVTVAFSGAASMGAVDAAVSYDSSVISFVSGENANAADGVVLLSDWASSANKSSISFSLTFKAMKAGTSNIAITRSDVSDFAENPLGSPTASTKVTVTSTAALSSDAGLLSLSISAGTLSPKFSTNVYSYSVQIPYSVTVFTISAVKSSSKAKYVVEGTSKMSVGQNTRSVVVTAENGAQKIYKITITRLAQTGTATEAPVSTPVITPTASPLLPTEAPAAFSVTVNGKSLSVVSQLDETAQLPQGYSAVDINYSGVAIKGAQLGSVTLLRLADEEGKEEWYVYTPSGFAPFRQFSSVAESFTLLDPTLYTGSEVNGLATIDFEFDGKTVSAFVSPLLADGFYIVYAINSAGEEGLYTLCVSDGSMQALAITDATKQTPAPSGEPVYKNQLERVFNTPSILRIIVIVLAFAVLALAVVVLVSIFSGKKHDVEEVYEPRRWGNDVDLLDDENEPCDDDSQNNESEDASAIEWSEGPGKRDDQE